MKINIIGDIAGRYDELLLLLRKMPEADLILSVGDMVDRGPKSKEVINFFMTTPNTEAVYGNHEDMMLEYALGRERSMWVYNGGFETIESYAGKGQFNATIPQEVIEWLQKRPMYFQTDDLFVSHCPVTNLAQCVPKDPYGRDHFFIWNRYVPSKPQPKFMVYGHNGRHRDHKWGDGTHFASCIDNSHDDELMGMHWPSKEIFTQKYLPVHETLAERAKSEQREMTDEEKEQYDFLNKPE